MLYCIRMEKLQRHLQSLAPLINEYWRNDNDFVEDGKKWLQESEQVMQELRLPEGAEMSGLRSSIERAADSVQSIDGIISRKSIRRAQNAATSISLERAEEILRNRLLEADKILNQFEEKLIEAVTAGVIVGIVRPTNESGERWLQKLWTALSQYEATRPTMVYLSASLISTDRIYLLERVTSRLFDTTCPIFEDQLSGNLPYGLA